MPPRTRTRAIKPQKENIEAVKKNKLISHENVAKTSRKPLADKTNSLSDTDTTNSTIKPAPKVKEIPSKSVKATKKPDRLVPLSQQSKNDVNSRPKRNCRVKKSLKDTPKKSNELTASSPFKTPSKDLESSLVGIRPKRICRLPSKFEDHFISPSKLLPVQPCHASTPIVQKNNSEPKAVQSSKPEKFVPKNIRIAKISKSIEKVPQKVKFNIQKEKARGGTRANASTSSNSSVEKTSPDTNNNGRKTRPKRVNTKLQTKKTSPQANKIAPFAKRLLNKSTSFRVLEDKEKSRNLDIYEFTFDPNDEPTPQKKKRKRTVRKKPTKPKTVMVPKSHYDENITKAITNLKSKLTPQPKTLQEPSVQKPQAIIDKVQSNQIIAKTIEIPPINTNINITSNIPANETAKTSLHESNYASIRVEDIAADFELNDSHDNINYSPVSTPQRAKTPEGPKLSLNDPLNLQDGSFFDVEPVASSSMNVSRTKGDPLASPWRVEFGSLPIKWHANTYVKPNMTPAVECSFINAEDCGKKKHVYTNMVPEEPLPQIEDPPPLKQTSIISFMKEVAERSANKKKRKRSVSPTKASHIFDDVGGPIEFGFKTPKKAKKSAVSTANNSNYNSKENISNYSSNKSASPTKAQKKDKDCTYFGFDDSENVSPEKVPNTRSKRGLRTRAVLKEFNVLRGPTRAVIPSKAKLTSSEVVEQLYDQLKSAEDAPQFPEKEATEPVEKQMTNVEEYLNNDNDDGESVHLFEDIELIHHLKPHRKSYSKPKRVAFQRVSNSDSDGPNVPIAEAYSSDDDLADLSFHLPNVKEKKVPKKKNKKKKLLSKKEEKEVEEWAADFNSMCEDVEEFPLIVE